ncbi:MAG: TlpA family protein disulfide reductase [Roseiflexus sp.]|nr:TlpA family protein disulfide reductase [Roseiflexus sp.]MCS7291275.1 TlpA family protein disulfide reductase [Roseiflexus sp.]MDW8145541.1 TlpA disulfide reductase family protein [Roseiflexaceae bacterium]MDW8231460.1 TlpA disulfide reductase family protein [Roseiflexaceae bacterium]
MNEHTTLPKRAPSQRRGISQRELITSAAGALLGVVIIGLVWFSVARENPTALPAVGELNRPAPDLTLPMLDGGSLRLADLRGKVVLVNFWGTWCEPCKEETPALQAAYQRLQSEGLVIVGVNLRRQEASDDAVRKFVQQYGVTYPIVLDVNGEAARLFQISPIPVSYFIDPEGTIRYVRIGTLTTDDVAALFAQLR